MMHRGTSGTGHVARATLSALLLVALACWLLAHALPAQANSIVVTTLNDEWVTNGKCSLREAVLNASFNSTLGSADCAAGSGSDRITFNVAGTIVLTSGFGAMGLSDAAGLTIDGGNAVTLSGGDATGMFVVAAGVPLTLSNLVLTSGNSGGTDGGAVRVNGGTLVLEHTTIQNSHCTCGAGSAIVAFGGAVSLVNGSVVQNNYGADYAAINATGAVNIVNSVVRGNRATVGGGALSVSGPVLISNSQMISNSAPSGGAILANGPLTLTSASVLSNSATAGDGGGLWVWSQGQVRVVNSLLASNVATGTGSVGGGAIANSSGTVTLNGVTLSGNGGEFGGGIYNTGTATLNNSTLSGNSAHSGGGGIANFGATTVNTSTLSGNFAATAGGAGIYNFINATTTVNSTWFSGNSASVAGGGIWNDGTLMLNNSTLSGNTASLGGGIENLLRATLHNVTLSGNSAAQRGGGIDSGSIGTITLTNSTLSGNSTNGAGGGVYNTAGLNLSNSTLSGNSAAEGGGIENAGVATLVNVTLDNRVALTGTAHNLYFASGVLKLTNTIVNFDASSGANCFGAGLPKSVSGGHNLANETSCGLTASGDQQGPLVPILLGPLANHGGPTQTQLPHLGSAAIDKGDDAVCNAAPINHADQRGVFRPLDGNGDGFAHCDVGAVERQPSDSDLAPRMWLPLVVR